MSLTGVSRQIFPMGFTFAENIYILYLDGEIINIFLSFLLFQASR